MSRGRTLERINVPASLDVPRSVDSSTPSSVSSETSNISSGSSISGESDFTIPKLRPGMYIGFRMAKEMMASAYPMKSAAQEAALDLRAHKFVGLITEVHVLSAPGESDGDSEAEGDNVTGDTEFLIVVHFVLRGRTAPFDQLAKSIPIYPAGQHHRPLRTTTAFPWKDCYQLTTVSAQMTVFASQIFDSFVDTQLTEEDFERFEEVAFVKQEQERVVGPMNALVCCDLGMVEEISDPALFVEDLDNLTRFYKEYPDPLFRQYLEESRSKTEIR